MSRRPVLLDLLDPGPDLVICATAVGIRSAEPGAYYVHGRNKVWRAFEDTPVSPREGSRRVADFDQGAALPILRPASPGSECEAWPGPSPSGSSTVQAAPRPSLPGSRS